MKKFSKWIKSGVVLCLACGLLATSAFAGNTYFSKYDIYNTGKVFASTSSYNTKTAAGANWFINVTYLYFGNANINGTLGMAYAPFTGSTQGGVTYWTRGTTGGYVYNGWLNGGPKGTYNLRVRLDDLIYPPVGGKTQGYWNAN